MSEKPAPVDEAKQAKNAAKKAAKEAKKAAKAAAKAKAAAERAAKEEAAKKAALDAIKDICGDMPMVRSRPGDRQNKKFWRASELKESDIGKDVLLRGRLHSARAAGNLCFLVLRQQSETIQAVACKSDSVPKAMVKFIGNVPRESIVDVYAKFVKPESGEVDSASVTFGELQIEKFFVVSRAAVGLPFELADAMTPDDEVKAYRAAAAVLHEKMAALGDPVPDDKKEEAAKLEKELNDLNATCRPVGMAQRLDNRCIDLRTPANQAIFRVQAGVARLFREFLFQNKFTEVHSPKMIAAKSEGGANVFEIQYFDRHAYLAQSPQFYKQMCMCADFERVFEVAPVFRAEYSFTPRHMTEFIGLDMEMVFNEHYHEVLEMFDGLFEHIFTGLKTQHKHDISVISQQYPVAPFEATFPSPLIPFKDGVKMLTDAGVEQSEYEDLSTVNERELGRLVKEKYNTDFYRLDKFPTAARPFYTMLDADDPKITNSYDFMMRGQEILSGAQRIHDMEMLLERAKHHEVDLETVEGYTSAFKYGAPPHAGGGIGLNRVTMLFLGLDKITKASLFPRLPKRLYP